MKKIVLFGQGMMFDVVSAHMIRDGSHEIAGITVDREWLPSVRTRMLGDHEIPIVPFDEVASVFPPENFAMFIAMGYHELNQVRAEKCAAARKAGYQLVSYISPYAHVGDWLVLGDNCLLLDGVGVQPGARLGNNVWVWNSSLIGHHSTLGDDCWLAAGTVIGGATRVGSGCFFGLGSTLGGDIHVGGRCFFGARSLVTKSCEDARVFVERDTDTYRLDSKAFSRISLLSTIGPGGAE